jgi:hypothetical protein
VLPFSEGAADFDEIILELDDGIVPELEDGILSEWDDGIIGIDYDLMEAIFEEADD